MSIQVTPIPRLTVLTVPAFTLGSANAAGSATTAIASDSTLLAFDGTLPDAITFGQSGAAGVAAVTSRRDHAHAMVADPANLVIIGTGAASNDADVTITGLGTTYDTYLIAVSDVVPATDTADLYLRVGDSGEIYSGGSDYQFHLSRLFAGDANYNSSVSATSAGILIGQQIGDQAGEGASANLWLTSTPTVPLVGGTTINNQSDGVSSGGIVAGMLSEVITLTRVQIIFSTGNITSGRFTVWGVAHA